MLVEHLLPVDRRKERMLLNVLNAVLAAAETQVWVLGEEALQDRERVLREMRLVPERWLVLADHREHLAVALGVERRLLAQQNVQQHAKAPPIDCRPMAAIIQHLGSCVPQAVAHVVRNVVLIVVLILVLVVVVVTLTYINRWQCH